MFYILIFLLFSSVDTVTANSRTFDAIFSCRGGVDYSFSNLSKEEFPFIETFLREKKIKFQNELVTKKAVLATAADSGGSDSELDAVVTARSGDELEESSTDEDYQEGDDETDEGSDISSNDGEDSEGSAVEED